MRLGAISKLNVITPAILETDAESYLNVPAGDLEAIEVRTAAIDHVEDKCSQAFDIANYSLSYLNAEGGESILLPEWENMSLIGVSAGDGTELDPFLPIVTLPDNPGIPGTPGNGAITFQAGFVTDSIKRAILFIAGRLRVTENIVVPALVAGIIQNHSRVWRNSGRPCQVTFNKETGVYRT